MNYLHAGLTLLLALTFTLVGCDQTPIGTAPSPTDALTEAREGSSNIVEVTATHDHDTEEHGFDLSTDEIASGWTTFQFNNATHADHFVLVSRVPEGIGLQEYRDEVAKVAQNFLDIINGAEPSAFPAGFTYPEAGLAFPAWYGGVEFMGGPGLTAPGRTSDATMDLAPGTYILECYIKTEDRRYWHHVRGMLAELTVTEEPSGARAPNSTLDLTLRNPENGGIEVDETIRPGKHTVAVHFAEQQVYATGGQNDVHLARIDEDTDLEELAAWMNAFNPTGLVSPPAPAEFIGGIEDMPAGTTGYFSVLLKPGHYAWISEVPDPAAKGMLKTFSVPSQGEGR